MTIDAYESFRIVKKYNLSGEDYSCISQLYLPIMGVDSFGLYSLLYTFSEKDIHTFKKLLDIIGFHNMNFLEQSLRKLEALGLVRTFYNEQKGYIIDLMSPLSVIEFLNDNLLSNYLQGQIGEIEVEKIRAHYSKNHTKGYKEVSKKFDEVFDSSVTEPVNLFAMLFKNKVKADVTLSENSFDYLFFKMLFDTNFIDEKVFDDAQFKQHILKTSYMYKLNPEEMKEVIMTTINIDKDLCLKDISKNARKLFQNKNKSRTPRIITKEKDAFISSNLDDETFKLLNYVDNTRPADLLENLSGIKPSVAEMNMIDELIDNTKFPIGVINLMILMVNSEKKGVLPTYNYFEKIANTWARANVKTTLEAWNYMNQQKNNRETEPAKQYSRKKKVVKEPEWYGEYEKQLENANTNKEMELTEEEIKQVMEEAKKMFNKGN